MATTDETKTASEGNTKTRSKSSQAVVGRVLNLSIFFVGVGVFAAAGFGMEQSGLFETFQMTYFAVGGVVGLVGILLLLLTR